MEGFWFLVFLVLLLVGIVLAFPFFTWARLSKVRRELEDMEQRLRRLEYLAARPEARPAEKSAASESTTAAPAIEPPSWLLPSGAPLGPPIASPSAITPGPVEPAAPPPVARPSPPPAPAPAPATARAAALEDAIGGVWMQNAGAVVLLIGVFLFILWGYSTGRIGAGVLVATGGGLGLLSVWRGDRLARSLPRLGYAFIGAGFGAVYLSLYLGHYTLHVLPQALALALLTLTSLAAFGAGLHYRVQAIAAFGVVGAFIPQLFAMWFDLRGFTLTPLTLLTYLAIVDVLVFALAARAGWSGLDLAALLLTTVTWVASYPESDVGWAPILALGALFTGLGVAPLPSLLRVEGRVRSVDVAVIACAPAALVFTTWSWLLSVPRAAAAMYLLSLAAVQLLAAAWVDLRRPERDLWRPLTGAAVVFVTLAIQRVLGEGFLAVAWGVEGVLLVLLGLRPRSGWLRFCGHVVTAMAVVVGISYPATWSLVDLPGGLFGVSSLSEAVLIAALLLGAAGLARGRDQLAPIERWSPEVWTLVGNLLAVHWLTFRCGDLTSALHWRFVQGTPSAGVGGSWLQWPGLFAALLGMAWFAQANLLALAGARAGGAFLRGCGHVVASLAVVATLMVHTFWTHRKPDGWPIFYPEGIVVVASMLLALTLVIVLARSRTVLTTFDGKAPEAFAVGLLAITLAWSAREAGHLANLLSSAPEGAPGTHTLAAALTSAAWLVEAVLLLALGWMRTTTLLRWAGLVLLGLTLAKFMIYDMASADVFWRFLTAIAAGAAMLAVSFAYQRRVRERRAGP